MCWAWMKKGRNISKPSNLKFILKTLIGIGTKAKLLKSPLRIC
jgi:hypothetical protein